MNLDNGAGHPHFWNRGWRTALTRLSEVNMSDLQWIKPSWYNKILRGTLATGLIRVKNIRWCFQIFPRSSRSLPQNEFCHCFHFHCLGVWQIRKDFYPRVVFKFTKYMLCSNIIKTVKWRDKRQGLLWLLLILPVAKAFRAKKSRLIAFNAPNHSHMSVQVLNLV